NARAGSGPSASKRCKGSWTTSRKRSFATSTARCPAGTLAISWPIICERSTRLPTCALPACTMNSKWSMISYKKQKTFWTGTRRTLPVSRNFSMNDHSIPDESIRVGKRDGNIEPFVLAKLLHSIRCGLLAAGEAHDLDTTTAGSLGEAVYDYLKSTYDGGL